MRSFLKWITSVNRSPAKLYSEPTRITVNHRLIPHVPIQIPISALKPNRIPAHPPPQIAPQVPRPHVKPIRQIPPVPHLSAEPHRVDRRAGYRQLLTEGFVKVSVGDITTD